MSENKKKQKSITINAILNVIKVGLGIAFSILTFPYASRVLQVANMGKVNYAYSVVSYFALFAAMGISKYAVREGAKYRSDKTKIQEFSSEIFSLNLLTTAFSYLVLLIMVFTAAKFHDYRSVILVYSISILFTTIGVEWLNNIYEDYLYITIRSIVAQLASVAALLLFVRTPEDYLFYAGITVFSNGIICVSNLVHCRRYVHLHLTFTKNLKRHLKPMFVFFSNTLAITIYVSSDMTMIGWMIGDYNAGLYSVAVKIYQFVKQLTTAIYTVTIPRLSEHAERQEFDEFREILTNICSVLLLILVPAGMGLIVLARPIILFIAGKSYVEATLSLQLLGIALIFAVFSGFVVNCMNTPLGKEAMSLKATVIAALINVVLNLIFIPLWQQNAAAVTTIISEISVSVICLINFRNLRRYLEVSRVLRQLGYIAAGCVWIWISGLISNLLAGRFVTADPMSASVSVLVILLVMAFSVLGYLVILFAGRNLYAMQVLEMVRKKLGKKTAN